MKNININTLLVLIERQIEFCKSFQDISVSSDINNSYFAGYIKGLQTLKKRIIKLYK